jgi:hypothetical protein
MRPSLCYTLVCPNTLNGGYERRSVNRIETEQRWPKTIVGWTRRWVQGVPLDDPGFLREIAERVMQQVLEAEMTERIGPPGREPGVVVISAVREGPCRLSPCSGRR